jgi:hypothetical protein
LDWLRPRSSAWYLSARTGASNEPPKRPPTGQPTTRLTRRARTAAKRSRRRRACVATAAGGSRHRHRSSLAPLSEPTQCLPAARQLLDHRHDPACFPEAEGGVSVKSRPIQRRLSRALLPRSARD